MLIDSSWMRQRQQQQEQQMQQEFQLYEIIYMLNHLSSYIGVRKEGDDIYGLRTENVVVLDLLQACMIIGRSNILSQVQYLSGFSPVRLLNSLPCKDLVGIKIMRLPIDEDKIQC
jgi:hypothetical protein